MNNSPIGIFDSGIGGLTVLKELKKRLPSESFIYFGDQDFHPYGKKTKKQIEGRAKKITEFLISKKVKLIVIACNTATIQAIERLRSEFNTPFIGTVPVIKSLVQKTNSRKTGVMATPATLKSKYLEDLINKFGQGIQVYKIQTEGLEELIEEGNLESEKIKNILKESLLPVKEKGIDAIALGCTHYPFIKKEIKKIVGSEIKILDSGGAIARQTKKILLLNKLEREGDREEDFYYTTADPTKFKKLVKKLTKWEISNIVHERL